MPALPLTSLFAWKPPHYVAGINSSNLGGNSNVGVHTASTKLAPLAPELCSDTKYSEIIFHDACAVRIFALLHDVTHYCVTSEVEDYFRKWYDGFRWFRPVCHLTWRRSLSREACVLWNESWEGLKLQKGFEYELSNTIVMPFILFSRFNSPHKGIRIRRTWPSPQAVEYSAKCWAKIFCRLVACYVIQYVTSHLVYYSARSWTAPRITLKFAPIRTSWTSSRSDNILSKMSVYMLGCS